MLLTQRAVTDALNEKHDSDFGFDSVAPLISRASLMGARGNSGVILSQVLRGICEALPGKGDAGPKQVAAALEHASYEAYRAVTKPAEGTMLSVLRDAKIAAREAAKSAPSAGPVLTAALVAARESLDRTRETHPDLRRAGVVDAGGKGIVLLLDALRSAVTGESMTEPVGPLGPVGRDEPALFATSPNKAFEVQYLLEGPDAEIPALRRTLETVGDSVVVVGGGGLFNVHVHADVTDPAVEAGKQVGAVRNVSIVSLNEQVEACMAGQARAVRVAELSSMIAVAEGAGLVRTLQSLGASVVQGGPGNNPSVADLVRAIESAPADAVLVLPNHRNVIPAAERAAIETAKTVVVVPTRSVAAGLAAATAFNPVSDADENDQAMKEALAASRSGEIARAERRAETPAGTVREGDWIGTVERDVVYAGDSLEDAAVVVARHLAGEDAEIVTLIVGAEVPAEQEELVRAAIARSIPQARLEVVPGGQPRYPFLIGVE
jgi:fatty acid kinase